MEIRKVLTELSILKIFFPKVWPEIKLVNSFLASI